MHFLTQNVLSYPESLETAGILWSACCFYVIRIDNDLITGKQLLPRWVSPNCLQWVQRMNSIRDWATEIVNNDRIYA